jgi:hypothetical protein
MVVSAGRRKMGDDHGESSGSAVVQAWGRWTDATSRRDIGVAQVGGDAVLPKDGAMGWTEDLLGRETNLPLFFRFPLFSFM